MRKKPGSKKQVFQCTEKLTIKMDNIIHKMGYQMPKTVFGLNIFLSTIMTKTAMQSSPTIQTNLVNV
jgi:hypothetical protein